MKKSLFLVLFLAILCYGQVMAQAISFEIRNEKVVGANYEFDIYVAADQNGTFHSRGQIYVNYNSAAFGKSLMTNGQVAITHLKMLTETMANTTKYATINSTDNQENVIAFTWQSNFTNLAPSASFHTEVPTYMTPLYHVSMPIQNPGAAKGVYLNRSLMSGQQFYLISAGGVENAYKEGIAGPMELQFSAAMANVHDVNVSWSMANEVDMDHYVIEKRKNNEAFVALTKVSSKGSAEMNTYEHLDQTGMADKVYYRLKQVAMDGTSEYSEVVEISFGVAKENDVFTVYPSPASDYTMLKASGDVKADYHFYVSDVSGRTLFNGVLPKGAANSEIRIDISDFAEGTYYVKTISPDGTKSYLNKLIKVSQ